MKKRIIPIIALVLVGIIAITTVVFAVCTKSYMPQFKSFDSISLMGKNVNNGSGEYYSADIDQTQSVYNELNDLFNKSFNESALNSLFNGRLGFSAEVTKNQNIISNIAELDAYIIFEFEDKTNLPTFNYNGSDIEYDRVLVQVETLEQSKLNAVKLYLVQEEANSSSYYMETYANFYDLFSKYNELIA